MNRDNLSLDRSIIESFNYSIILSCDHPRLFNCSIMRSFNHSITRKYYLIVQMIFDHSIIDELIIRSSDYCDSVIILISRSFNHSIVQSFGQFIIWYKQIWQAGYIDWLTLISQTRTDYGRPTIAVWEIDFSWLKLTIVRLDSHIIMFVTCASWRSSNLWIDVPSCIVHKVLRHFL